MCITTLVKKQFATDFDALSLFQARINPATSCRWASLLLRSADKSNLAVIQQSCWPVQQCSSLRLRLRLDWPGASGAAAGGGGRTLHQAAGAHVRGAHRCHRTGRGQCVHARGAEVGERHVLQRLDHRRPRLDLQGHGRLATLRAASAKHVMTPHYPLHGYESLNGGHVLSDDGLRQYEGSVRPGRC
jgi:hypothetical protein